MHSLFYSSPVLVCRANDNDAYIPERWTQEGVLILEENMVMAGLVHRDFNFEVAQFGDVVNTRKPGEFNISRKTDADNIVTQDASSTNIQVTLDQHFYTSFVIKDGEASKSFQDLVDIYLTPGMQSIARSADRAILGRVHELLGLNIDRVGRLNALTGSNASDTILDAREVMNNKNAHMDGRNLVLSPSSETAMLKTDLFLSSERRGDGGTALENARLGRILGFDTFMDQNVNSLTDTNTEIQTGTVTDVQPAGEGGSQTVVVSGHEVVAGEYVSMFGNDQPTFATASTTGAGDTTAITLNEVNKFATAAVAAITVYKAADVNGVYAVGYSKLILIDGVAVGKTPQIGQLMSFGTGASRRTYTIIESIANGSDRDVLLDRPLEVALANNDLAFPGPSGSMNLAFHRNAITFVNRPLALPDNSIGARFAVTSHNDVSMRITMQYNATQQGTIVTLDMLAGVAILEADLAVVLLG